MVKGNKREWKSSFFTKVTKCFDEYSKCFIVGADHVGSKQLQEIRMSLRGHAVILMGKNTMMKKAIKDHLNNIPSLEKVLPHIVQNVGFIFTNGDLMDIQARILQNRRRAPARAGAVAPCAVTIVSQNTGLGPEKTSFFQALQIPTRISRGTIEIVNDVQLLKEGDKVGLSEATLLNILKISPFTYGLVIQQVYDQGTVFSPRVLDITEDDLISSFKEGLQKIASASLAIGYPTMVSAPHSIINGFKNMLAIAAVTDVSFKEAETLKEYIANPSKFVHVAVDVPDGEPPPGDPVMEPDDDLYEEESDDDFIPCSLFS